MTGPLSPPDVAGPARSDDIYRNHIASIDGLRAISILLVLVYHVNASYMPGGFVGVDIFFVISGFVVARSVHGHGAASLRTFALFFYRRRAARIVPALVFFLLLFAVASAVIIPITPGTARLDAIGVAAFFGLSNVALWHFAGDYFAPASGLNVFTHTWSLGVEEQFYLVFPFVAFFMLAATALTSRRARGAVAVLAAAVIVSFVLAAWLSGAAPDFAFFMLPTRLWELGAGVLLFVALTWRGGVPQPGSGWIPAALLPVAAGLLVLAAVGTDASWFPVPWALPAVMFAVLALATVTLWPSSHLARMLALPAFVQLGRISYSLYLSHFGIIVLLRWTTGMEDFRAQAAAVVLSFALALVSFRFVEMPFRQGVRLRGWRDGSVVMAAAGVLVVSALAATATFQLRPQISASATVQAAIWDPQGDAVHVDGDCRVVREKTNLPGGWRIDFHSEGCAAEAGAARMAVMGDSHAAAYDTLVQRAAAASGAHATIYIKQGCPFFKFSVLRPNPEEGACAEFRRAVLAELERDLGAGDILFMPSLRTERFDPFDGTGILETEAMDHAFGPEDIVEADRLRAELAGILDNGVRIVLEAPKPVFRTTVYRCVDWFTASNPVCADGFEIPRAELELRRSRTLQMQEHFVATTPGTSLWDPFPVLCPGADCSAMDGNQPLFYDSDHLSRHGNLVLLPYFLDHLSAPDPGLVAEDFG